MVHSGKMLASREKFGCVYECSCGTIHLSFGPVDLKFTPESFLEAFDMLRDAVERWKPFAAEAPAFRHVGIDESRGRSH